MKKNMNVEARNLNNLKLGESEQSEIEKELNGKRERPKKVKIIRNPYGRKGKPTECHSTSGPRLYLTVVKILDIYEEAISSP